MCVTRQLDCDEFVSDIGVTYKVMGVSVLRPGQEFTDGYFDPTASNFQAALEALQRKINSYTETKKATETDIDFMKTTSL